ncbi:MAG: aldehyde dehydrogenase [Bacteroidales bacterium]|nr:aldehyde dehydrogenase [Bacteroidales bacterium]
MNLDRLIEAFSSLGQILREALAGKGNRFSAELNHLIDSQQTKNPWFTPPYVRMAVNAIASELTTENLRKWTDMYPGLGNDHTPLTVAVIMAGNIPMVGFHDFMCVLISGNRVLVKVSSKDADLIRYAGEILETADQDFRDYIEFTGETLSGFDAVIATGSDNTSRYFEYYFGKYPNIIRKNRNSIAILDGSETKKELEALGLDIFSYFGLGCRSVSKLYVPAGYDFKMFTESMRKYSVCINHTKYANNYDYYKAIMLVNRVKFTDTGYLLLKQDESTSSPVSVLHYEFFRSKEELTAMVNSKKDKIQCIVGRDHIPFGLAQSPALWDYADGTDTLEFLLKKNCAGIL